MITCLYANMYNFMYQYLATFTLDSNLVQWLKNDFIKYFDDCVANSENLEDEINVLKALVKSLNTNFRQQAAKTPGLPWASTEPGIYL